jgi:predicted ribosome quality control (RQC) complex YloA/Tae2 family protein
MVKQRMSSADVAAEVACLRHQLLGLRLANIYDLNPKVRRRRRLCCCSLAAATPPHARPSLTRQPPPPQPPSPLPPPPPRPAHHQQHNKQTYVLKLARSGEDGEKAFLLLESGSRLHTVDALPPPGRGRPDAPSNFCLKLRKHLRTRRLEDVRQLGVDRVVDLVFGSGEAACHLILEMYAGGNLVLCDGAYTALTLLRSHRDDARGFALMARRAYPMHAVRLRRAVPEEEVRRALEGKGGGDEDGAAVPPAPEAEAGAAAEEGGDGAAAAAGAAGADDAADDADADADAARPSHSSEEQDEDGAEETTAAAAAADAAAAEADAAPLSNRQRKRLRKLQKQQGGGGDGAAASTTTLRSAVASLLPYGPLVAEHVVASAGLDPDRPLDPRLPSGGMAEPDVAALVRAVRALEAWFAGLEAAAPAGFVTAKVHLLPPPKAQDEGGAAVEGPGGSEGGRGSAAPAPTFVYQDFNPIALAQLPAPVPLLTAPAAGAAASSAGGGGGGGAAGDPVAAAVASAAAAAAAASPSPPPSSPSTTLSLLHLAFPTFDAALRDFFARSEGQRRALARADAERGALQRLERVRADLARRSLLLEADAREMGRRAELVELNLPRVDGALDAVNAALAAGSDWRELAALIAAEKKAGNPVAALVHALELEQGRVTLALPDDDDDEDDGEGGEGGGGGEEAEEEEAAGAAADASNAGQEADGGAPASGAAANLPALSKKQQRRRDKQQRREGGGGGGGGKGGGRRRETLVSLSLSLSAYANARELHDARKRHLAKHAKTLAANGAVLKAAEKKAAAALAALRSGADAAAAGGGPSGGLPLARKPAWYERFHWFVTSENFLVVSGRDAQQNELLVKRYLRPGDAYVHAELHGASSTIVRNHQRAAAAAGGGGGGGGGGEGGGGAPLPPPVPPLSLQQAGCACVCRSRAWDAKVVTSAWWVHARQVSKSAPTGEYLPTGSFMVRGRKNYLPPQPLVFGLGFLFRLEDACVERHRGERAIRSLAEEDGGGGGEGGDDAEPGLLPPLGQDDNGGGGPASALDAFLDGGADPLAPSRRAPAAARAAAAAAAPAAAGSARPAGSKAAGGAKDFARYGLEHPGQDAAAAAAAAMVPGEGGLLGKGGKQQPPPARGGGKKGGPPQPQAPPPPAAQPPRSKAGAARGKSGKAAKAAKKYADQDEEDRQLALQLLQSGGTKKSRSERREQRKQKKEARHGGGGGGAGGDGGDGDGGAAGDPGAMAAAIAAATGKQFEDLAVEDAAVEEEQEEQEQEEDEAAPGDNKSNGGGANDGGEDDDEDDDGGEDGVAAALAAAKDDAERAEIQALLDAEDGKGGRAAGGGGGGSDGDGDDDDDEQQQQQQPLQQQQQGHELDALTGRPLPDDVLLYAVPVCGPYSAMADYKHKVKLVPGGLKKGRAARAATEALCRAPPGAAGAAAPREAALMRAVPEMDTIMSLVGTVKISMPGMQKMAAQHKKERKKAAQKKAAAAAKGGE